MPNPNDRNGQKSLPTLVVVYAFGSASATQIVAAARGLCDIVLLADRSEPYVAEQFPLMLELASVIDATDRDEAEVLGEVTALAPSGVTTFADDKVELAARLARACGVVGHSEDTVEVVTDKLCQRRRLTEAGVEATRFAAIAGPGDVAAAAAEVGFPAVLKPRRGNGARNTRLVESEADCELAVTEVHGEETRGLLLEEALTGIGIRDEVHADYVSVESLSQDGGITTLCVTGRFPMAPPMRETGMIVPAALPDAEAERVVALERAILRALGVRDGLSHTEFKLTADGPRLIEVNARLGGPIGHLTKLALGIDVVRMGLLVALGQRVEVPPPSWRGVAFNRAVPPPLGVSEVVSVKPLAELRGLPGVVFCNQRVRPGDRVDSRRGERDMLATVVGLTESHEELLAINAAAERAAERMCR
ncbi:ATP-grasp domain-containing protein [Stackebrandtia nassauensis]|uniref:ATP-dependent carboxylate-amine ligase domain protein ATP-grasp n=1 Tax=Stackebrandtia nassauensis (strain DSM 44728 / CIP 108903 / NRRL B-16338 / NBRC 102104 / LLR-40K-21) TaxID=446470 RepID=D3Q1R5_STANL|nr:ATP-grasp domain-containing protein [Stackebrandtia nassauensis]ADD39913.1 ATP-dependent carboxylate-amine ligase domain protein ATP-grasp [Stackebrandtia nassauensis DSM 44728]